MIKITSFASGRFTAPQKILTASALKHGVDVASCWGRTDIVKTEFYHSNKALLEVERGAGYWIWKPYIILEELRRLKPGDVLIYSDVGLPDTPNLIDRPLNILVDWCVEEAQGMMPGTYIPERGDNRLWTKGECFRVMACDSPAYRNSPQIQATFSVWQRHDRSLDFIQEWLRWCTVPAAISDDRIFPGVPDDPDFIDHRHDQSIVTLLALRHGLRCFGQPHEFTPLNKNMSSLVDRISGRTWSLRSRLAREERRLRGDTSRGGPVIAQLRKTKRYVSSIINAVRSYP